MLNVIFGDFRARQLQSCYKYANEIHNTYNFIIEDDAEYLWFGSNRLNLFKSLMLTDSNIIIMLGFNDCVFSCIFNNYDLDSKINNYIDTINDLVCNYESTKFYFCSINPIDCDYYFKNYTNEYISKKILTEKIVHFNNRLRDECEATFIDSFSYLIKTGFSTRDGVRFVPETSTNLLYYINSNIAMTGGSTFERRASDDRRPVVTETGECDLYWKATKANGVTYGGLNRFNESADNIPNKSKPWDTLPNCTSYAWGRFYEILGTKPTFKGNACDWYGLNDDYERGKEPREGAVVCWSGGSLGAGHVAIVEEILPDGKITISESGWQVSWYWRYKTISKDSNGNYVYGSSYTFQGFIYNPKVSVGGVVGDYVDKSDVTSENKSLGPHIIDSSFSNVNKISAEMKNNARYIWQYLGSSPHNWSLNAVAGMLGNMQAESTINPGRWQGGKVNVGPGYGLTQWTPFTKFTNWVASEYGEANKEEKIKDIDVALQKILLEVDLSTRGWISGLSQWQNKSAYDSMTFKEFIKSEKDCEYLAEVFLYSYERPSKDGEVTDGRKRNAKFWYEYLLPYAPGWGITFAVTNFKIDVLKSTSIQASFIVSKGKKGHYNLYNPYGKKIVNNKNLVVTSNEDEMSKIVTFTNENLTPNTRYKLEIIINGEDSNDEEIQKELVFTTKQDYPKSTVKINFKPETLALPNQKFNLDFTGSTDFGYWSKNNHGYFIYSIINGKKYARNTLNNLESSSITFSDSPLFKNAEINVGDIIQIGLDIWVEDDNKNIIFEDNFDTTSDNTCKTSNSVCLLNNSIKAFLNN